MVRSRMQMKRINLSQLFRQESLDNTLKSILNWLCLCLLSVTCQLQGRLHAAVFQTGSIDQLHFCYRQSYFCQLFIYFIRSFKYKPSINKSATVILFRVYLVMNYLLIFITCYELLDSLFICWKYLLVYTLLNYLFIMNALCYGSYLFNFWY